MVTTAISVLSWSTLLYSFAGKQVLNALGVAEPPELTSARENRLIFIVAYLALTFLSSQLGSTGAFEVTLDGTTLLWSKLQKGGAPSIHSLIEATERAGLVAVA